jgi:hypothetical protein
MASSRMTAAATTSEFVNEITPALRASAARGLWRALGEPFRPIRIPQSTVRNRYSVSSACRSAGVSLA